MNRFQCAPKKNVPVEMTLSKARELVASFGGQSAPIQQAPVDNVPPAAPSVLSDAVSVGGSTDGKSKPFVRHVLVKDLHKIARQLQYKMPRLGIFSEKAPMGLYALFDGQSCAGDPGPIAAEFSARNFHTKLLERLSALPDRADQTAVVVALRGAFEDLDKDLLENHQDIQDGCGAAVALLIGGHVFTALLGQCRVVLGKSESGALKAWSFSGSGEGALVSRSLGDAAWKSQKNGAGAPVVSCNAEVRGVALGGSEITPFLLLVASAVVGELSPQELVDIAKEFPLQPRAACGEIAARALESVRLQHNSTSPTAQCTVVQVTLLPPDLIRRPEQPPAAKKAKLAGTDQGKGIQSVRLRHILVRFQEGAQQKKEAGAKMNEVTRSRTEGEAMLRTAITTFRQDVKAFKKTPKDATELVSMTTAKFAELCKVLSECETAKKGVNLRGELGWLTPQDLSQYGAGFKEAVEVLLPGQLSDIAASSHGLHLVQRMA